MIRVARMGAQRSDQDLRLRPLWLVDEDEVASAGRRRVRERGLDMRPLRERAHERRAEGLGLVWGDRSGKAQDDVALNEPPRVICEDLLARDGLDAGRPAGSAPR